MPGAFGTIIGRIDACSGLSSDRTVAGIVTVTKGVKSTNHTTGQAVILPGVRVSTHKVPAPGQYRFEIPAGPYLLESVRSDPDPTGPYEYV